MRKASIGVLVICCVVLGCHKAPEPVVPPSVDPVRMPVAPTATVAAGAAAEVSARLATAYHEVRCTLIGARPPRVEVYTDHGFAGANAFNLAFETAARADPEWARRVVAGSYERGCAVTEKQK